MSSSENRLISCVSNWRWYFFFNTEEILDISSVVPESKAVTDFKSVLLKIVDKTFCFCLSVICCIDEFKSVKTSFTEFSSALESVKIAIFEALGNSNLKGLVKEASGWITELTKATDEGGINGLVEAFGSIFAKVVTKITSMTPKIVQAGVGLVSNLISGVKSNLPQICKSLY